MAEKVTTPIPPEDKESSCCQLQDIESKSNVMVVFTATSVATSYLLVAIDGCPTVPRVAIFPSILRHHNFRGQTVDYT